MLSGGGFLFAGNSVSNPYAAGDLTVITAVDTPEPATAATLLFGLVGLMAARRRSERW